LPRISVREDPIMKMVAEEIKNYFWCMWSCLNVSVECAFQEDWCENPSKWSSTSYCVLYRCKGVLVTAWEFSELHTHILSSGTFVGEWLLQFIPNTDEMNSKSLLFSFCEHWWGIVSSEFSRDIFLNLGKWWLKWMFVFKHTFWESHFTDLYELM
jgi:hypothetical protein